MNSFLTNRLQPLLLKALFFLSDKILDDKPLDSKPTKISHKQLSFLNYTKLLFLWEKSSTLLIHLEKTHKIKWKKPDTMRFIVGIFTSFYLEIDFFSEF